MSQINNFEGENEKILEVVSDISCYSLLRRCGNNNLKVYLPLNLCMGRLSLINEFNRDELREYVKYIEAINNGPFKYGYNFEYEFDKIKSLNQESKIRV